MEKRVQPSAFAVSFHERDKPGVSMCKKIRLTLLERPQLYIPSSAKGLSHDANETIPVELSRLSVSGREYDRCTVKGRGRIGIESLKHFELQKLIYTLLPESLDV